MRLRFVPVEPIPVSYPQPTPPKYNLTTVGPNVITFTDTGLDPTKSYAYEVASVNGNGQGLSASASPQAATLTPTIELLSPSGDYEFGAASPALSVPISATTLRA